MGTPGTASCYWRVACRQTQLARSKCAAADGGEPCASYRSRRRLRGRRPPNVRQGRSQGHLRRGTAPAALNSQLKVAKAYADGKIQRDLVPVATRNAVDSQIGGGWGFVTADE